MAVERTIVLKLRGGEPSQPIIICSPRQMEALANVGALALASRAVTSKDGVSILVPGAKSGHVLRPYEWMSQGDWDVKLGSASTTPGETLLSAHSWAAPELVVRGHRSLGGADVRYPIDMSGKSEVVVGRGAGADISLDDLGVSGRHFRVRWIDGAHWIEDLRSRHGTMVNDVAVTSARRLANRDRIQVGRTVVEYVSYLDVLEPLEDMPSRPKETGAAKDAGGTSPSPAPEPGDSPRHVGERLRSGAKRLISSIRADWVAVAIFVAGAVGAVAWLVTRVGKQI